MKKLAGLLLVILGIYLLFKINWFLFLLLAALLALGAASGVIGRWGFGVAAVLGFLAVPMLMLKSVAIGLALLIKLAPLVLVVVGVLMLLKVFK